MLKGTLNTKPSWSRFKVFIDAVYVNIQNHIPAQRTQRSACQSVIRAFVGDSVNSLGSKVSSGWQQKLVRLQWIQWLIWALSKRTCLEVYFLTLQQVMFFFFFFFFLFFCFCFFFLFVCLLFFFLLLLILFFVVVFFFFFFFSKNIKAEYFICFVCR